jgi:hypothetical protein
MWGVKVVLVRLVGFAPSEDDELDSITAIIEIQ